MTARGNEKLIQWGLGIAGSLILSLGGWVYNQGNEVAQLKVTVNQLRGEVTDLWMKYNNSLEQRTAAIERLVKVESCCEDCKDKIQDIERSQRWKNKN